MIRMCARKKHLEGSSCNEAELLYKDARKEQYQERGMVAHVNDVRHRVEYNVQRCIEVGFQCVKDGGLGLSAVGI